MIRVIIFISILSLGEFSWSQEGEAYNLFQCIPARVDYNKMDNGEDDDPYKSIDIAVIDEDGTKGQLEVYFAMPIVGMKPFDKAKLIMNIPDIGDASSANGVSIYYNDHKLGSCDKIEANTVVEIDLDLNPDLKYGRSFALTIKANGADNTYVYRWHSGWGVMLALYK